MRFKTFIFAFFDVFFVTVIFCFFLYIKPQPFLTVLANYLPSFLVFLGLWFVISFVVKKYQCHEESNLSNIIRQIIVCNLLISGMATTLMYLMRIDYFSRTIVFGTILTATTLEIFLATFQFYLRIANIEPTRRLTRRLKETTSTLLRVPQFTSRRRTRKADLLKSIENAILYEIHQDAYKFIFRYAGFDSPDTLIISTTSQFNIDSRRENRFDTIINLKRINDIRFVNKFFESANAKLPIGGLFIDYVETKDLRKKRILKKFPPGINYVYYFIDFIVKRLFPKFSLTKGLYFFLTRGQNRVITKAETFGRLYSCGFEVIDEKNINNHLFFIARKITDPIFPEDPTYGPFVKLERIGFNGKIIRVFKLRTMHPYAEYLQEYIFQKEGLQEGGKFKSDFRISTMGRILRTFWLDELPMLINWVKGELKLVGVRPLSRHYFNLYTRELQKRRIRYKPGLVPPFYKDMPKTLEEIMASEKKYLDAYDKHPFRTDFSYFFAAFFNIVFKRYRSN